MKLVTFDSSGDAAVGAILPCGDILELAAAARYKAREASDFATMLTLIEAGERSLELANSLVDDPAEEAIVACTQVRLLAPLKPPRMRDTLMYVEHMEQGLDRWARNLASETSDPEAAYAELKASGKYDLHPVFREKVIYYNADHVAISGPDDEIEWPAASTYADYEIELACIIGHDVRNADAAAARQAIFGYTIYNDWSARDLQLDFMQASLGPAGGKDFAGGNTLGPWIVTADEIADPYDLRLIARVNGEVWTDNSTSTMHHRFEDGIVQFSRLETMIAGEVIGSGTVLNGSGYEQGRRLKDGDLVELEIEGIGVLRNTVCMQG